MRLAVALVLAACGGASPPPTVELAPEPAVMSLEDFAGVYTLEGTVLEDSCNGRVVLRAQHLTIDAAAHSAYADVVDRTYDARIEEGRLVADGRFDRDHGCPDTTIYERWDFAQPGAPMVGELTSTWQLAPECSTVCTVRVAIQGSPAPPR